MVRAMNYIASIFCTFIICHSPQKSSVVQKVYKPALCSSARPFAPYSSLGQAVGSGPACQGLPLWGSWRAQARLRGQGCCQTALRSDRIAPTTSLPIAARRLSGDRLALSVTPVAPPLPKGEALAYRKAQKAPLEVATPRGFFLFGVTILTLDIPDFSISDFPQKSSAVQKVYSHSSLGIYCIFLSKFMI